MLFSEVLGSLIEGQVISRKAWSEYGAFLLYQPTEQIIVDDLPFLGIYHHGAELERERVIYYIDSTVAIWNAQHSDILADDWLVLHTSRSKTD